MTKKNGIDKAKLPTRFKGAKRVAELLKEAMYLKGKLDKRNEGSLAWKLEEIKDELNAIQQTNELQGLRSGRLCFIARLYDGKAKFNKDDLKASLLDQGVDIDVITKAFKVATSEGSPYWIREFSEIKE